MIFDMLAWLPPVSLLLGFPGLVMMFVCHVLAGVLSKRTNGRAPFLTCSLLLSACLLPISARTFGAIVVLLGIALSSAWVVSVVNLLTRKTARTPKFNYIDAIAWVLPINIFLANLEFFVEAINIAVMYSLS